MTTLRTILDGLAEAIVADEANAAASFEAQARLVGVTEVDVTTGNHRFTVDEPEVLGGTDLAANPVQLVLAALGACQAITYRVWAAKLGIELETVEARVEGDIDLRGFFGLDQEIRPGFRAIRLFVNVGGPEPVARYEELVDAVNAHCPVLDIIGNPVPITAEVTIAEPRPAQRLVA